MIIAIDFDGTIVEHNYPEIGKEVPFAIEVIKRLQKKGHRLILHTMRCGKERDAAVQYCSERGIRFWTINHNPEQIQWTTSKKIYAHYYIDDAAIGVPLISPRKREPYVDWKKIEVILRKRINNENRENEIILKE